MFALTLAHGRDRRVEPRRLALRPREPAAGRLPRAARYYEIWLAGLERLLAERELVGRTRSRPAVRCGRRRRCARRWPPPDVDADARRAAARPGAAEPAARALRRRRPRARPQHPPAAPTRASRATSAATPAPSSACTAATSSPTPTRTAPARTRSGSTPCASTAASCGARAPTRRSRLGRRVRALPGAGLIDEDPVFAEPWEAQAFALAVALHERGAVHLARVDGALADEIRRAPEESYYEQLARGARAPRRRAGRDRRGDARPLPPTPGSTRRSARRTARRSSSPRRTSRARDR